MSEIVYYITTNETVLTEQYTNDKSLGKAPPPRSWHTSSFSTFNGSCKFAWFL